MFLSLICFQYYFEDFKRKESEYNWILKGDIKQLSISNCSCSSINSPQSCLIFKKKSSFYNKNLSFSHPLNSDIFFHFITKGVPNSLNSHVLFSAYSQTKEIFVSGIEFSPQFQYFLKQNQTKLCSGPIIEDGPLTHSFSLFLSKNGTYYLYIDGYSYGSGKLDFFDNIFVVSIELLNGNKFVEFGHFYISNTKDDLIPVLSTSLLKYRPVERENLIRDEINEIEKTLFNKIQNNIEELEPIFSLKEEELDINNFKFPFLIGSNDIEEEIKKNDEL